MPGSTKDRLDINIAELKKIIEAEKFSKEEAFEFLYAIADGVADLWDTIASQDEEIDGFEHRLKEAEDAALTDSIEGQETIEYSAPNLMDSLVMESLGEAYEKYKPAQIIEKLK